MCRADGGTVWVRRSVIAATDEAGRIVESRSIVVDITDLRTSVRPERWRRVTAPQR